LRPIIEGLGQKSNCPICGGRDVYVYDTERNTKLIELFDELISIYTPVDLLPVDYPRAELRSLKTDLVERWNIFNRLTDTNVYKITTSICAEKYQEMPALFDDPVGIAELYIPEYLRDHSLLRGNSWDEFVLSLKTQNRFHTSYINLDILERYCSYIRKPYKKGNIFFRGRISSAEGLPVDEMGVPPLGKSSEGRANASGIKCLYIAKDVDTTIHEVRAGAFDFISVGKFELQEDIIVADLKAIDQISPFIEGLDCLEHAVNKKHLNKINFEMGRALRRSDSTLDYVPTQYISDFIKSVEHDGIPEYAGIEYNSTINPDGFNLAIFYPELLKCIEVETYSIKKLRYTKEKI
jgi:hypothetical protein